MGVRANFSEIAFDIILPVADSQPLWERVAKSSVNWAYTNWKGMAFGLLFAAAILNLLSVLSRRKFKNRWLNTLLGVVTGAPLGVCVNCATPIAQGLYASGARIETSLATLISSPTLNVIVLTMSFTLLPLNLALGKLICVIVFILLIPWLVKLSKLDFNSITSADEIPLSPDIITIKYGWWLSFKKVSHDFILYLVYIVKIALPLMLLAGLLGALVIELFPFSNIKQYEPSITNMIGLALVGVFLPVPIAFDVLTGVALLSAGSSAALVAVLLFSLGSFSIYPFLMIYRNVSARLSLLLAICAIFISILFGLSIKAITEYESVGYGNQLINKIENAASYKSVQVENAKIVKHVCQELPGGLQRQCMANYLLNLDNHKQIEFQCDFLPAEVKLPECLSLVELSNAKYTAIENNNITACHGLSNQNLKNSCLFDVITQLAVKHYDIGECDQFKNIAMLRGCRNRYIHQGIRFQVDGSVCNSINDLNEKEVCNKNLKIIRIVEQENISDCDIFSEIGFKQHCQFSVASRIVGKNGDVSVCHELSDSNMIERCKALYAVRQAKKNVSFSECYAISFARMKKSCLLDVAKLKIHKKFEGLSLKYVGKDSRLGYADPENQHKIFSDTQSPKLIFEQISSSETLDVKRSAFNARTDTSGKKFKKVLSESMGVSKVWEVRSLDLFEPYFMGKGIASGDYNNDNWPDLLVATESGVALYKNSGGMFSLSDIVLPDKNIFIVVFVDLDNDGFQDIFATTYGGGNFIVYNDGGEFSKTRIDKFKGDQKLTILAGFVDVDRNNYLDIVMGNWSSGAEKYFNPELSENMIAYRIDDKFVYEKFLEPKGETLSVLLSDLNNDAYADVLFANDHIVPDMFYFSNINGELNLIDSQDSIVPVTPRNSMSIDSADFNNDLHLDVFSVDMIFSEGSADHYCDNVKTKSQREHCNEIIHIYDGMKSRSVSYCEPIEDAINKKNCYSAFAIMAARTSLDDKYCNHLKEALSPYYKLCTYLSKQAPVRERVDFSSLLHQKQKNVLLISDGKKFTDKAQEYMVDSSYWSWNSKAADLDNDQWQDIYVGNGYHFGDGFYEIHENILFRNIMGDKFEQTQKEWGLDDKLNTSSYTYSDFDLDGDIDIITTSFLSGVTFYINQGSDNNSLSIKLVDSVTNINAIGAQLSIFYGNDLKQIREIKLSGGFMSFDNPVAHFGLGKYTQVSQLIVRWPDGVKTTIDNPLQANYLYEIQRKK